MERPSSSQEMALGQETDLGQNSDARDRFAAASLSAVLKNTLHSRQPRRYMEILAIHISFIVLD